MKFPELLQDLHIQFKKHGEHKHTTPGRIQICCPFCDRGLQSYHMGYHLSRGNLHCWRCGSHSALSTLLELTKLPYKEVKQMVESLDKDSVSSILPTSGRLELPKGLGGLTRLHKEFLVKKGLDPCVVVPLWGLQGIGVSSKLSWRVWIPIKYRGDVVSWTTRSVREEGTYHTARPDQERISSKTLIFGEDMVGETIIVVEGPLDAMRIGPGAGATCGIGYTREQVLRLANYPRRIIAFDNEYQAQRQARKICTELEVMPGETINVVLETGKDASRASDKEIALLRRTFLE